MESTTFFKAKSNNLYLYDSNNSMFLLTHPLIRFFYQLNKENIDNNYRQKSTSEKPVLEEIDAYNEDEIQYYKKKYEFLRSNGFFKNIDKHQRCLPQVTSDSIRLQAANIKQILFEVTEMCNLKCKYCTYEELYSESENRKNTSLDIDSAKAVINFFSNLWNSDFNVSGKQNVILSFYGGEALLNVKFIKELIVYIKSLKTIRKNFSYSITTNGLLLKKYIDFLVEHNFAVTVSLDGNFSNNQYRVTHSNENPHEEIVSDLLDIKSTYPDFYEKNIEFNTVLHDKNSVESVYHFFDKVLNKTTKISEINTDGAKPEKADEIRKMLNSITKSYIEAKSNDNSISLIEWDFTPNTQILTFLRAYWGNYLRTYNDLYYTKIDQQKPITGTCSPFWKKMFITAKGLILPCERIDYKFSLGKVKNGSVNLNFDDVADVYNTYYQNIYAQCSKCHISRSCLQCMFYVNNIENKPNCDEFHNSTEFEQYLKYMYSEMESNSQNVFSLLEKTIYE